MAPNGSPDAPPPAPVARRPVYQNYTWWLVALGLLAFAALFLTLENTKTISLTEFDRLKREGQIKKLVLDGKQRAKGEVRDPNNVEFVKEMHLSGGKFAINLPVMNDQRPFIQDVEKADADHRAQLKKDNPADNTPEVQVQVEDEPPQFLAPLVWGVLPLVIVIAFFVFYLLPRLRESGGGGFASGYVRSPARKYEKGKGRITFEEVAGMDGAKRELREVVDFLRNPDKFARLGGQVPKGVLLVGPPGTGKTLLAKAVAGEANVPFYSINGSEFIQMYVGVGASRVRDLFKTAKENAPCVIFIDEIDAVGRMRGAGVGGGSDEREQTLNQILGEMDGFHPNETVIVLAATNRPDVLDAALLRPGRFDRHVTIDKPTWQGRLAILKVHTRNKPVDDRVNLERIARAMIGMSGADLRNLCNEAALHATREGKNKIEQDDFDAAADRVRLGAKRDEMFGEEEKRRTAYHEAGHALTAYLEPKADPIDRVSIVPRGRAGGVTLFSPDEDRLDLSHSDFLARLVVLMGGRAADKLTFGEPLSVAIMDIKQATRMARAMVTQYGMSDRLGPVHYRQSEEHVFLGKEIAENREFSEGTARIIDEEVQRLVSEAEKRATELLTRNRDDLEKLAAALLANEELDRAEIHALLRKGGEAEPAPAAPEAAPAPAPAVGNPALAFGGA
ncbi:MAG: ATP-dependent zinc metalloprotease FtsH [Gemmataceae bacterium]